MHGLGTTVGTYPTMQNDCVFDLQELILQQDHWDTWLEAMITAQAEECQCSKTQLCKQVQSIKCIQDIAQQVKHTLGTT